MLYSRANDEENHEDTPTASRKWYSAKCITALAQCCLCAGVFMILLTFVALGMSWSTLEKCHPIHHPGMLLLLSYAATALSVLVVSYCTSRFSPWFWWPFFFLFRCGALFLILSASIQLSRDSCLSNNNTLLFLNAMVVLNALVGSIAFMIALVMEVLVFVAWFSENCLEEG